MKLDKYWIDTSLNILWILAFIIGALIFAYLFTQLLVDTKNFIKNNSSLLAAFFILLSASIASASVMKSIHNANKIEKNKNIEKIDSAKKYLKILIDNFSKELHVFNYILDKNEIFNSYNKSDIANNILSEEIFDILKDFYYSENNKLFITQIQSLVMFLKNITSKLEDKDIVYYSQYNEDKMYDLSKSTLIVIEVLESNLYYANGNENIYIQKYMLQIAGLKEYINVLQNNVNNFFQTGIHTQNTIT